jgi:hypothetical protein
MNRRLLYFNGVFYLTTIWLIIQGINDSSSSLGYGMFILGFWIISIVALIWLILRRNIRISSTRDKIGVFTATPIISIIVLSAMFYLRNTETTVAYYTVEHVQYKVIRKENSRSKEKQIEIYRNASDQTQGILDEGNKWVKDSVWLSLSQNGDTIREETYRNDTMINRLR